MGFPYHQPFGGYKASLEVDVVAEMALQFHLDGNCRTGRAHLWGSYENAVTDDMGGVFNHKVYVPEDACAGVPAGRLHGYTRGSVNGHHIGLVVVQIAADFRSIADVTILAGAYLMPVHIDIAHVHDSVEVQVDFLPLPA